MSANPAWSSASTAEELADRLEAAEKRLYAPADNALLLWSARKLREQSTLLSNATRLLEANEGRVEKIVSGALVDENEKLRSYAEGRNALLCDALTIIRGSVSPNGFHMTSKDNLLRLADRIEAGIIAPSGSKSIWVNRITEGEFTGCLAQFVHDSLESAQEGARDTTNVPVEFREVNQLVNELASGMVAGTKGATANSVVESPHYEGPGPVGSGGQSPATELPPASNAEFREGDRVRVVKYPDADGCERLLGKEGVFQGIWRSRGTGRPDLTAPHPYRVTLDGELDEKLFSIGELAPVTESLAVISETKETK